MKKRISIWLCVIISVSQLRRHFFVIFYINYKIRCCQTVQHGRHQANIHTIIFNGYLLSNIADKFRKVVEPF